ncbi:MAG: PadR family transcriptional regulator [Gammaproteobacteria bacterium]|nr:PadR family transcriptional regulator [Gammaproteobacteria bacterium]MYC99411.1 helix-turn-helix transcriptional regulator [Gammaproteobacteria bacterium]
MSKPGTPGDQAFDAQGFARGIHELLVLAALREEPRHGYQIALDVEAHSNGVFRFRHGTLYPLLHRMEANGLIQGRWSSGAGRRKKVYSLTDTGRRHLSGEADRVEEILAGLMQMLRRAREVPA